MIDKKYTIFELILIIFILALTFFLPVFIGPIYIYEITAIVFILFYITKHFKKNLFKSIKMDILLFSFVITSIVNTTGYLESNFVFLLYFLIFAAAFFLEIKTAVAYSFIIIFFYLLVSLPATKNEAINLLGLILIIPFSWYLSLEKKRVENLQARLGKEEKDFMFFIHLEIKKYIDQLDNYIFKDPSKAGRIIKKIKKLISEYEV